MLKTARVIGILAVCGLTACGDSTGVDELPDIGGNWTYNLTFSNVDGSCTYDPSAVTISQADGTFTGRIEIPDATCTPVGGTPYSLGSWGAGGAMSGSMTSGSGNGASSGTWTLTRWGVGYVDPPLPPVGTSAARAPTRSVHFMATHHC